MIHRRLAHKGFTLIETIIYIGLSGLVLAGVLSAAYPMFTNTEKIVANVTSEGETLFIMRKISWALSDVVAPAPVAEPAEGTIGSMLRVNKTGGSIIVIRQSPAVNIIELSEDGGSTWHPLNASRVSVTNFSVKHIAPVVGGLPRSIEVSFTANGKTVGPVRHYIHF